MAAQALVSSSERDVIIVTAQRRPESPDDVPISLTALTGDQLDQMQAASVAALGKVVPSLTVSRTGAFTQPYLRGVGKRSTLGVENGVATYVDGVYMASSISVLLDLQGVERVEVLNGPQGTLFGRNTTAGVIQIVTRDPSPQTSAAWRQEAGSYGDLRGDFYVNGGSDRLSGNLALSIARNGGYGSNLRTGKFDQGAIHHALGGRTKLVWRPDAAVKLTFAADYQDVDQDFANRPVAGFVPIGHPRVTGFRNGDQDASNRFRLRYGGVSLRTDVDIGSLTLMSLTALRQTRARFSFDLDLGPADLLSGVPNVEQKQFSQEFQLQSPRGSRFEWVAGLYYIGIEERYEPTIFRYGGSYSALLGGRIQQTLRDRGSTSSYAAYGQGSLPLGDRTRLTVGLRYTSEHKSVRANGERLFDNPPFVRPIPGLPLLTDEPFRSSKAFDELTWRASVDRHFSDTVMGYLVASRGFQSGGWNLQTPQNPAFRPERLTDFEAGVKYVALSRRIRGQANVFHYDYSDLQVSAATPIGSATTNATSAKIHGLELQLQAQLSKSTSIDFGGQLLSAKFQRFRNATCTNFRPDAPIPYAPITCDVSGNHLPFAPDLKFQLGASHVIPVRSGGTVELRANLAYSSGYFAEQDNVVQQHAFATLDASAEWRPGMRNYSVRLWVSNLTDARYYNNLVIFPTAGVLQSPAAPRRIGVSCLISFR